jgi:hypothetical protein
VEGEDVKYRRVMLGKYASYLAHIIVRAALRHFRKREKIWEFLLKLL